MVKLPHTIQRFSVFLIACFLFAVVVYSDGVMDIVQDAWSPGHLTSIQSFLTDPYPESPANPEAAHRRIQ